MCIRDSIYLSIRNVREQQHTSAQLAGALKLKNDFIADASHELRTPLTVLRANAELARSCLLYTSQAPERPEKWGVSSSHSDARIGVAESSNDADAWVL